MNAREKVAIEKYEAEGYDVITKGVPDLILLKDGNILFMAVKDKHAIDISLYELEDLDEAKARELFEDLIKYINRTSCQTVIDTDKRF